MAHDVFICYATQDKPTADAVCASLEAKRKRCWMAPRDVLPGVAYGEALIQAIAQSRVLILVFSSWANRSQQVMREVERAVSKGIPVLPFRIQDVTPSPSLEYFISSSHWLDALTPPLEKHIEHLAGTVELLLSRTAAPKHAAGQPEPSVPPPSVEAAADEGLGRPAPPRAVLQSVKGWAGRPMAALRSGIGAALESIKGWAGRPMAALRSGIGAVLESIKWWTGRPMARLALGFGTIAAVIIIVLLVALLFGGGKEDSSSAVLAPSPTEGTPTVASRIGTVGPTPTPVVKSAQEEPLSAQLQPTEPPSAETPPPPPPPPTPPPPTPPPPTPPPPTPPPPPPPQVAVWIAQGEGTTFYPGDIVTTCYSVSEPMYIDLIIVPPSGPIIPILSGFDDGTGGCLDGLIEPSDPPGSHDVELTGEGGAFDRTFFYVDVL